jgi:hypothetical protein
MLEKVDEEGVDGDVVEGQIKRHPWWMEKYPWWWKRWMERLLWWWKKWMEEQQLLRGGCSRLGRFRHFKGTRIQLSILKAENNNYLRYKICFVSYV